MVLELAVIVRLFDLFIDRSVHFLWKYLSFFSVFLVFGNLYTLSSHAETLYSNTYSSFGGNVVFENPFTPCSGGCGAHLFGGTLLDTSLTTAIGLEGFKPPWEWEYGNSHIAGFALSRRLLTGFDSFNIEGEVGIAQRFGAGASATETWGALYLRWFRFPWNEHVYTTIAVSTGLSYATHIDEVERTKSIFANSKLLHYLSPEITFALPDKKDLSLVFRLHHRSGGRDYLFGKSGIFNGTSGGAQYMTVGIKYNF